MLKTRTSAVLSLALVFVSGSLLGALAYRAYTSAIAPASQPRLSPADWRKRNLEEMRTRLKLDPNQSAELDKIFDKVDDDYRQLGAKRRAEDQAFPTSLLGNIKRDLASDRSQIGMTEEQVSQVDGLIDRVGEEFRRIGANRRSEDQANQAALVAKIDSILRPDQKVLYAQLRDEREKERQRRRMQQGGPGGFGGPGGRFGGPAPMSGPGSSPSQPNK